MSRISLLMVLGVLSVAFVAGCDKEVTLLVTNTNPDPARNVVIDVPGDGPEYIGTLMPGDRAKRKVKIDKDDLPAALRLRGNGFAEEFSITEKTKSPLMLYIDHTGVTTVGKHDKVEMRQESKCQLPPQQDTVVVPPPCAVAPQDGQNPGAPAQEGQFAPRIIHQDTVVE